MAGNGFFKDPNLIPIQEKVLAQERLTFEDGLALYRSADLLGVGLSGEHRPGAAARQQSLLHYQPAYQLFQYLHQRLQVLRLRQRGRRSPGVRDEPGGDFRQSRGASGRADNGNSHCRGVTSGSAVLLLSGDAAGHQEVAARRCICRLLPPWRSAIWPGLPA